MLGNAPDYFGILLKKFLVTLLRCVADSGKKKLLVVVETFCQHFFVFIAEDIIGSDQGSQFLAVYCDEFARFYAFKREKAGRAVIKAIK